MTTEQLFIALLITSLCAFFIGRSRAVTQAHAIGGLPKLHSLPNYYGSYLLLWVFLPAAIIITVWGMAQNQVIESWVSKALLADANTAQENQDLLINQVINLSSGVLSRDSVSPALLDKVNYYNDLQESSSWLRTATMFLSMLAGFAFAWFRIDPNFRARNSVERSVNIVLLLCACIAILTTLGIVLSVLAESLRFFSSVPATDFIFGTVWSPQTAIRADQVGSSGSFGALPLFAGTLLISAIAMLIAVPTGLMTAIYLGEYAHPKVRTIVKPMIEMLAGVPTVVYGFIAALTVAPFIRQLGEFLGLSVSSESALAAGLVMGVMIIPFVSSLSDDVINSVPQSLRDGALALGATRSETIRHIVFPAALPGIMGAILLAASRAIGETMIVVMAAGLAAKLTANPLEAVTTITVQIVTLLTGDQEFDSPKTLAAFALGLMLFITTLALNFYALYIVKKYREQYD